MKLSKDAIKRLIFLAAIVGLLQVYDAAKKHSKSKAIEKEVQEFVPQNIAEQQVWFKSSYLQEIQKCLNIEVANALDPYMVKYAYLYQSQIEDVKKNFPTAREEDQIVVAQNQFYRILTDIIEKFANDYANKNKIKNYLSPNIGKTYADRPYDTVLNAAIHRVGRVDQRQTESFRIAVNTRDIAKQEQLVKTKYFDMPSVQLARNLIMIQHQDDEQAKAQRNQCFDVLENHPSLLNTKN